MGTIRYLWQPAQAFRAGRTGRIRGIVVHCSDGREAGDVETLTGPRVSCHWYVTRGGRIWHFVQDADTAYHAGRARAGWGNAETIGIEQEHLDGREDFPAAQVQAVAQLIVALRQKHGQLPVKGHSDIALPPGRKQDPVAYPWSVLSHEALLAAQEAWTMERDDG